ncbi:lectin-like [Clupea harengus]|uniref:Lectin-like n=1 Tax=Clupea harengus TaxID=7950 RepID=A0A8M1KL03_CLUHA|nr:lectin-like [Clupea harengus]
MMFRPILVITLVILLLHEGNTGPWVAQCPVTNYSEWSKLGPYCVKYFQQPVPFGQAEMKCRGEAPDSHLISIHDGETNNGVQILTGSGNAMVWIGGMRLPNNGNFVWTDGSKWDYTNWVPGQPDGNGDCVQINWNSPGMWDDVQCWSRLGYICAFKMQG